MEEKMKMVEKIIGLYDKNQVYYYGGYPSDWTVKDGIVYRATSENGRPILEITPIDDFIAEGLEYIEEMASYDEDDEEADQ